MQLNPNVVFNGQCEAAFKFYEKSLGGRIERMLVVRETPMAAQASPEWRDKIAHGRIRIGDLVLMGGDAPPGRYQEPKGFTVTISVANPQEAERVFGVLAEGGRVEMPLQETFWATRFGMLVDRFGVPWMVNCEKPE